MSEERAYSRDSRCFFSCFIDDVNLKRCIREASEHDDHLWVEATNSDNLALVVRWNSFSKKPTEILMAKVVQRNLQ